MDARNLTCKLMFVDYKAAVSINNIDPSISWGGVDHSIHLVKVKANYIFAVGVDHLRHLVVNVSWFLDKFEELDAAVL